MSPQPAPKGPCQISNVGDALDPHRTVGQGYEVTGKNKQDFAKTEGGDGKIISSKGFEGWDANDKRSQSRQYSASKQG